MKKVLIYSIMFLFIVTGCSSSRTSSKDDSNGNDDKNNIVKFGERITYNDNYEIAFLSSEFITKIAPTNPNDHSSYFEVKDKEKNTYVLLKTIIKNLGTNILTGDSLPVGKFLYDGKNEYSSDKISENGDGSNISNYSSDQNIEPFETKKIWYYAEVPNEVAKNTKKSLTMEFTFNNKDYSVKIR